MKIMSKICIVAFIVVTMILGVTNVFAGNYIGSEVKLPTNPGYDENNVTNSAIKTKANSYLGTFIYLVQVVCIATLVFMGLRYMFTSAEGKANIKKELVVWCVGAVFVFSATTIIGLVVDVVGQQDVITVKPIPESQISDWAESEWNTAKGIGLVPSSIMNKPGAKINRGEFAESIHILATLLGVNLTNTTNVGEVTGINNTQLKNQVQALLNVGIVQGTGTDDNGKIIYDPNAKITREQVATMLHRTLQKAGKVAPSYAGTGSSKYSDVSEWARPSMEFMHISGIIKGDENGNLNPQGTTTCEEAILMIYRIYNTYK